uniref:Mitochondrial fission 1 protein n=1 Tax=Aegilops tauschii subsp. strangulata TaxID=200361 RepID=A0A452Z041_AEGTS
MSYSEFMPGCEREVAEAATEEQKNDSIMRLSWALVHSKQTDDVNRGIGMIEASLDKTTSPLQTREKLYLLAVGHYRNGNYVRSRQLADRCLELMQVAMYCELVVTHHLICLCNNQLVLFLCWFAG